MDPLLVVSAIAAILAITLPVTVKILTRAGIDRDAILLAHMEKTLVVGGTPRDLFERRVGMDERKLAMAEEVQKTQLELAQLRSKHADLRSKLTPRPGFVNPETS